MPALKSDPINARGWWLLTVGVFTCWLMGLGLVFILAAGLCGFIGLFRERAFQSFLLLVSATVLGLICAFIAVVTGIYAFQKLRPAPASPAARVLSAPERLAKPRK